MSENGPLFEKWFQEIRGGSEGQSTSLVVRVGIVQVAHGVVMGKVDLVAH